MAAKLNILLIGSGGREHAIAWKLAQSERVAKIYAAPGNTGINEVDKVHGVKLDLAEHQQVGDWCLANKIDLVVVGPEDPLANGIVDDLTALGIRAFGPRRLAAQIEASKHFCKSFMDRHGIPSAKWKSFTKPEEAKHFILNADFPALVVKASGLAAGKGVIVASDRKEAVAAVDEIMSSFGAAGETIVVEELLQGEEVSVLAFSDGTSVSVMLPSQDHKRLLDGDNGPNTGGMGAYCPCPLLNDKEVDFVAEKIIQKTIKGLKSEGIKYCGVLYAGLMVTSDGPKVLEFNCRFGDPETQVILPLLESDLLDIFEACVEGSLADLEIKWKYNTYAVGTVMASAGYPGSYAKGKVITKLEEVTSQPGHFVFHAGTAKNDRGHVTTSGGRVLIAVTLGQDLALAAVKSLAAVQTIEFEGAQYRHDIAKKGVARSLLLRGNLTYKSSGVDIDAGDSLVKNIGALVISTKREGVMGSIGDFGGFFDLKATGYKDPLLVSGTDGVGTKLKIAEATGIHDTIGIDLVAMCVNDILAHAAEPLFFLDYFACGKLHVETATKVIMGVTEGCRQAGCALIGGETAEMPGVYLPGTYDLAGFALGAVERGRQLPLKETIVSGDVIIGLSSSGPHSNGYSLIRQVVRKSKLDYSDPAPFGDTRQTLGEALLAPTRIYVKSVLPALRSGRVKAFAHITGGGLTENIPRVLRKDLAVTLDAGKWPLPPVFGWIAGAGGVPESEMLRTFNCGLGAIMIVSQADLKYVLEAVPEAFPVGHVKDRFGEEPAVTVKHFANVLAPLMKPHMPELKPAQPKKRVALMVSLPGSCPVMEACIKYTQNPENESVCEIVLVISNEPGIECLEVAEKLGVPTAVISHKDYPKQRALFEDALTAKLEEYDVEFIFLSIFGRILTDNFVGRWRGKLINDHPALLPSFKGWFPQKQAFDFGARIAGCTIHFVEVALDAGAIIAQAAVPVEVGDEVEDLRLRIKAAECVIAPKAVEDLARGRVTLSDDGKAVWDTSK